MHCLCQRFFYFILFYFIWFFRIYAKGYDNNKPKKMIIGILFSDSFFFPMFREGIGLHLKCTFLLFYSYTCQVEYNSSYSCFVFCFMLYQTPINYYDKCMLIIIIIINIYKNTIIINSY